MVYAIGVCDTKEICAIWMLPMTQSSISVPGQLLEAVQIVVASLAGQLWKLCLPESNDIHEMRETGEIGKLSRIYNFGAFVLEK